MDSYYTPEDLALRMLRRVLSNGSFETVADFAAGDGRLLHAAKQEWPLAQFVATDINRGAVRHLRKAHPDWKVDMCNFMSASSRRRCEALRGISNKVSLVLLNPPFSCRGGTRWQVMLNSTEVECSLGLGFVVNAIPYLSDDGQIIAILPYGSQKSEKDAEAWALLKNTCHCSFSTRVDRWGIEGCRARSVIVRLTMRRRIKRECASHSDGRKAIITGAAYPLLRGSVPMHSLNGSMPRCPVPIVHSTDLQEGVARLSPRRIEKDHRAVTGPLVLIPRVGKPIKAKVCLYLARKAIVLSDCVIGIKCVDTGTAKRVQRRVRSKWSVIERAYGGTCAPYVTMRALKEALGSIGLNVSFDPSSQNAARQRA